MIEERLQGVAVFVEAAEAGSFALAASRLRVTRSAVAKRIAKLEQRLGVRLFHRTTRLQTLTEDGQAYYEYCKRALSELETAEASLEQTGRDPRGRLRVSAPSLLGQRYVAPILSRMAHHYPKLDLQLWLTDQRVDLLAESFDLAVRIGPLPDSSSLAARKLGTQVFRIYASPAYLQQHGVPQTPDEFAEHEAIAYAGSGPDSPWEMQDDNGALHSLPVNRKFRFNDMLAICDAAVAGFGLARLPSWLAAPYVTQQTLLCLPVHTPVAADVHAVWPATRFLPMKTRVAIDALVAELAVVLKQAVDSMTSA